MLHVRQRRAFAVAIACLAALGACQRREDAPPAAGPAPPAPATAAAPATVGPAAPGAPAPARDVPPPEGVLRAYVWQCDDGRTLRMKNLYRENAVTLEMHEGPRKLPLVVSASGARYSDGSLTFWTKGDTATLQHGDAAAVQCRELRAESLLADARERGMLYRGTGNEPGWSVEIGPDGSIVFVTDHGQQRHGFSGATSHGGDQTDVRVYRAEHGAQRIKVTVHQEPCTDDMSGAAFDHRMVVEFGGRELRGCATALL